MDTTAVRQLLRSLCIDSQWEYAVFWRLKHRNRMFLTWEDGYCDYPKARSFVESMSRDLCFPEFGWTTSSSQCEINSDSGNGDRYPIGVAVASMSCLQYLLGEGTVGGVASTKKPCWIFSDEFDSNLLLEYPDEWKLQFALGIKTILLVPIVPLGVVQLGSLEKVSKEAKVVTHIKDMFNTLQLPDASMPLILCKDLQGQSASSLTSHVEISKPSVITSNLLYPIHSSLMMKRDLTALDYIHKLKDSPPMINPDDISQLVEQEFHHIQKRDAGMSGIEVGAQSLDLSTISFAQNQSSYASHFEQLSDISNFSFHEEVSASTPSNLINLGFNSDSDMNMNMWFSNELIDLPHGDEIYKENDYGSICGLLPESELHKALAPPIQNWCNEYVTAANIAGEDIFSISSLIGHTNLSGGFEPTIEEFNGCFSERSAKEDLLDAVVASALTVSCETAFNKSNSVESSTSSSGLLTASCQTHCQPQYDHLVGNVLGQWGYGLPSFVSKQEIFKSCPPKSSSKSTITTQVDVMQQKKGFGHIQTRRGNKLSPVGKRKSKLDVQKQRPRDRQMIQDRVRELRDLVPNGAKCSIDSLLDLTVKHMLFLRNVTNQAQKLKQQVNRKFIQGMKDRKSSETVGHHNSRDWKFELGRQLGVCPVIVEDLDHPGHMLIEA